ncbi:hypothetical protein [Streptomyces sp. NRRL F-5123]|uniref:hypothetical protein n=1 Tax=Streptomyces sp. NRRL F-5123 TaxID=1463856 RepID=UPI0004E21D27|nr:hypothetical protein [Streptomyces sp. NRRL F-5123]
MAVRHQFVGRSREDVRKVLADRDADAERDAYADRVAWASGSHGGSGDRPRAGTSPYHHAEPGPWPSADGTVVSPR